MNVSIMMFKAQEVVDPAAIGRVVEPTGVRVTATSGGKRLK